MSNEYDSEQANERPQVIGEVCDAHSGRAVPLFSISIGQSIVGVPEREGPSVELHDLHGGPPLAGQVRTWILSGDADELLAVIMPVGEDALLSVRGSATRISRRSSGYRLDRI